MRFYRTPRRKLGGAAPLRLAANTALLLSIWTARQTSFISHLLIVAPPHPIITEHFAECPEKHYVVRVRDYLGGTQLRMIKRALPALCGFPLNEPR